MPRCDYLQLAFHHNRPSPRPASLTPLKRLFCSLYSRCLAFSKNKPGIPHPGHEPPQTNVAPISPQPLLLRNKLDPQLSNRRMTTHARTNERTNERRFSRCLFLFIRFFSCFLGVFLCARATPCRVRLLRRQPPPAATTTNVSLSTPRHEQLTSPRRETKRQRKKKNSKRKQ